MSESKEALAPNALMTRSGFVMHKAGQRALSISNQFLAKLEIDVRHYSILTMVLEKPCSQVEMSEALRVDRTSLVQLVDDLEQRRLVRRTVNPEDRRAHAVIITAAGRKVALAADAIAGQADDLFLAPLEAAERAVLLALLTRLM